MVTGLFLLLSVSWALSLFQLRKGALLIALITLLFALILFLYHAADPLPIRL